MNHKKKLTKKDSMLIERLYVDYNAIMYEEAIKILKEQQLAEDAMQQAFIKIIDNLHKIDEENKIRTKNFLTIICRNVAIDIYNKRNKITPMSDYIDKIESNDVEEKECDDEPVNIVISKETENDIINAIGKLPEIYKDVIILESYYDYPKKKIAELMNLNYDTVKKRIERGRNMLAEVLKKEGLIR